MKVPGFSCDRRREQELDSMSFDDFYPRSSTTPKHDISAILVVTHQSPIASPRLCIKITKAVQCLLKLETCLRLTSNSKPVWIRCSQSSILSGCSLIQSESRVELEGSPMFMFPKSQSSLHNSTTYRRFPPVLCARSRSLPRWPM